MKLFALAGLLVAAPSVAHAQEVTRTFDDVGVTLTLSGFEELEEGEQEAGDQRRAWWIGTVGRAEVYVSFWVYGRKDLGLDLPEDVVYLVEGHRARVQEAEEEESGEKRAPFRYQELELFAGPFGYVPYTYLGVHTRYDETKPVANHICLGGIGETNAYGVEIWAEPALSDDERKTVLEALATCISYAGPAQEAEWTEEELVTRWEADAPDEVHEKLVYHRTEHYLILSNCGKGSMKSFGKKMEEFYAAVKEVYDFEEVPGEKLLPVFLFRTDQQYYDFCVKTVGWTEDEARDSKGMAWHDYYATWYEAPRDPVHIHEATHQIFKNRLRLPGGGSWFQEGVAEYMSTSKNERKAFKKIVKEEKHVPLEQFFLVRSLLMSQETDRLDGGSDASDGYLQAACLIEFVRESKEWKDRFRDFVHAIGRTPYNDVAAIERALGEVYGVDLEGFEKRFLEYWRKRR